MQHYTTLEQSKKLLELGLNPESADMSYAAFGVEAHPLHLMMENKEKFTPCWSLGALLELMPKEGVEPFTDSNPFVGYGDGQYRCVFLNGDWESSHQTLGDTQIEAAYDMVVWLIKNGYIKKGK